MSNARRASSSRRVAANLTRRTIRIERESIRDRGYGIVVDDGEIVQLDPEEQDGPEEE